MTSDFNNSLMLTKPWHHPIQINNEMPTVLRIRPYRFFFFASDRDEPLRIHVEREDSIAKFWLEPVRLQSSGGFSRNEIGRRQSIISEHQRQLKKAWHAYFYD